MDDKIKYDKLVEVIGSMSDYERKFFEYKIEESLKSYNQSLEEYTKLVERQYMNDKITGDSK